MKPFIKHAIATSVVLAVVLVAAFGMFVQLGVYNFAADVPHTPFVFSLLDRMREKSIRQYQGSRAGRPAAYRSGRRQLQRNVRSMPSFTGDG